MPTPNFDAPRALRLAAQTLDIEATALVHAKRELDEDFTRAMQLVLASHGRVVVMGMGKSGHVGRKIAATLASTGTPSLFVHPAEASHGDLGMVTPADVVLAISHSGESDELNTVLPVIKRLGVPVIAITGRMASSLARHADAVLSSAVEKEACPLNLAPTASTAVQMAMGDALAVALLDARGFRTEDFARSHPGGSLGRKLLTHVSDLMRAGDAVPYVTADAAGPDVLREMSRKRMGMTAIVDLEHRPVGIFTDGDLRRLIESGADLRVLRAGEIMVARPKRVRSDQLAAEAATVMELAKVTSVLVVDANDVLVGALSSNDLLRAKVI